MADASWAQEAEEAVEAVVEAVEEAAAEVAPPTAEEAAALAEAEAAAAEAGDYSVEYAAPDDGDYSIAIVDTPKFTIDNLWICIAGCLVFIMHLGFAMVESGLTRAKNTVNILFKNSMIICIGFVTYGIMGFNLHYPGYGDDSAGWFAFAGFGFLAQGSEILNDPSLMTSSGYGLDMTAYADFFFQAMFCATGATIVCGSVAGRIKLLPFLIFITFFTAIVYPLVGSWHWGGGYLNKMDTAFYDFAGSTVVHSVGGWGALVGAIVLGPRLGKYASDGTIQPIPGHNMPLVTIGVFLLWFGWFGFNGGSVLAADAGLVSLVLCTTTFAAAAGGLATAITSWVIGGKPDLSMALNGILAGLVGITAGADQMAMWEAVLIGAIAGVLVYFSVLLLDKLKIDDPVGAVSVHLTCGIWGTLVVGIFGDSAGGAQLTSQIIGIVVVGIATVILSAIGFLVLKFTLGIRVSEEEEIEGLDLGEHDMSAYPDFQQTFIKSYHAREI
ncbi:ammonium transporter [Algisphaera agarilytica]|nr:ammonium transporter [Algisphaera agarilytica]